MKYVIIGGGAAGIKAAEQIRSLEKDSQITIIMEDMNIHSRCMLHKYLSGERNIEEMSFLPKEMEDELNIEFFRGYTISSVDTDRKLVKIFPLKDQADDAKAKEEMEDVSYDKLLIATGSNGFIPPAPGLREAKNVHCFRHLREAEIIREKALNNLNDEVPHGIAVTIEHLNERENRNGEAILDVTATIYCERESHKGILIGKGGSMLRKIGQEARADLEDFFQIKVNLQCWVKVKEGWRNREGMIKNFGLE